MERIIPMSWVNQMLLAVSLLSAVFCLIVQEWVSLTPLPTYASVTWAVFVTIVSIWLSCILLRITLKANSPINVAFINNWLQKRFESSLQSAKENKVKKDTVGRSESIQSEDSRKASSKEVLNIDEIVANINSKCIDVWYTNISSDKTFPNETEELLKKLLTRLVRKISLMDKVKLTSKLADVLLLHLKEYRRALRRVNKGSASNIEEAYKCSHPGSRSALTLEHMLHCLVTVFGQEFLQWELTSSLPCKLLLSILAKRLLLTLEMISCPNWIFDNMLALLQLEPEPQRVETQAKQNGTISVALSDGITSATAAVIPRPIPKPLADSSPAVNDKTENTSSLVQNERPVFHLEGLEHKGLWGDSISDTDLERDEDRVSPVYEEPTDFATTIARLRTVLQQKSTASTPLHTEEKPYIIYEDCQFTNLSIPWTEFHTASDGSQQLLYCIQFDDVEQRGVDLFETTTATVRRQYSDFAQLHASLLEIPSLSGMISDLVLPEGGRVELETYLKTLCTRLAKDCPPQLRHFLRPSSGAGKRADAVAPRFDRFLAKTVSGVVNTLKTVVPGFEMDQEEEAPPLPTLMPLADIPWRFVEDIKSKSLMVELDQLISERADYYRSVDTAYEAVDSTIEGFGDTDSLSHWYETINSNYDEEIDELDSNLTLTCTAIDLICEVLAGIGSNNTLQQEAVVRWTKLLFGNITETIIQKTILWTCDRLSNAKFARNADSSESVERSKDKVLELLEAKIPFDMKLIFGEDEARKALRYLLNSCDTRKLNMDLNLQLLDVFASQLLATCRTNRDEFSP